MLTLTRKNGERIVIEPAGIVITIHDIEDSRRAKVSIAAPREQMIVRYELLNEREQADAMERIEYKDHKDSRGLGRR